MNKKQTTWEERFFENELEFIEYIKTLPISKTAQDEVISHEKAHYEVAKRLGYQGKYAVECIFLDTGFRAYRGTVKFKQGITNPDHARQILSAPEELSENDKRKLEEMLKL
jgi:hypothetical protein